MDSTDQERFTGACTALDFAENPRTIGGYDVWGVDDIAKGGRVQVEGPYFTQAEAEIAANRLKPLFPFARAFVAVHCSAWNPDPRREKAVRDDAIASRMMLAEQIGADIPRQGATSAPEQ